MIRKLLSAAFLVSAGVSSAGIAPMGAAQAAEPITFVLNWFPGGDHAPYYFAKDQGWYEEAGIDLTIETGKGSAASAQRVGAGQVPFGISELPTSIIAQGKGAKLLTVMAVYANSPQGFYWDKSRTTINSPKDFAGHSIGNPPGDAARAMWPAFANAVGIDPDSVNFVNVAPQAKLATLISGQVDIITDFYNGHDLKIRELGDNMGYVSWREVGINPIGNAIIVNAEYAQANPDIVEKFVQVTQKAFRACVDDHQPCIDALMANASGLDRQSMEEQWQRVEELMTTKSTVEIALGYLDPDRVKQSYGFAEKYLGLDQPFDPETIFTNEYLSQDVKMAN